MARDVVCEYVVRAAREYGRLKLLGIYVNAEGMTCLLGKTDLDALIEAARQKLCYEAESLVRSDATAVDKEK